MLKRSFDVSVALLLLFALAPIEVAVAVAVKVVSGSPVIYRAVRTGRGGETFTMYKFRTMTSSDSQGDVKLTPHGDSRVTSIGRFLRRFRLDELPQLWNVVKGDMSLVGPRPEDPRYVAHYKEQFQPLLKLRPGITGPATVAFRDEGLLLAQSDDPVDTYLNEILPKKLEIEFSYQQTRSFVTDLGLIARTVGSLWTKASIDR